MGVNDLLQYIEPSFKHYAVGTSDCGSEIKDAVNLMGINISDSDVNRIKDSIQHGEIKNEDKNS